MIKTNEKNLIVTAVHGTPVYPSAKRPYLVDHKGDPYLLPSVGGITYNVKVGDTPYGWAGDHIEPCVSTMGDSKDGYSKENSSYHFYACIGNTARLVSGDAKGKTGVVTGQHGGTEHIMIDFPDNVLAKMTENDRIQIKAVGMGLTVTGHPDVHCFNADPGLVKKMGITEKGKKLRIPVAAVIPGKLMGSGVGSTSMGTGDYDIMTADTEQIKQLGLDKLKLGDIVAITDHDNVYGRCWRKGAVTIGVVVHCDCYAAGHGPGVTTIISSPKPLIEPVIRRTANIGFYLKIGRYRKK